MKSLKFRPGKRYSFSKKLIRESNQNKQHRRFKLKNPLKSSFGRIVLTGTLLAVMLIAVPTASANQSATVKGSNASSVINMRQTPSTSGKITAQLKHGTQVTVLGSESSGWQKVNYNSKVGYIQEDLLSKPAAVSSLREGMSGSAVEQLQTNLRDRGYFKSSVTGYYGPVTTAAVKAFQKANGLSQDGVAGSKTLNLLSTSSGGSLPASTLKEGMTSSAVKELQKKLKTKGYLTAEPTGFYGSMTKVAVMAFQKANGLSQDGVAGPKTIEKLNGSSSSSSSAAGATVTGSLRYGMTSSSVTTLQKKLKEKGYLNAEPTGYYGSMTKVAVAAFQKANGLSQDGVAGAKTLAKLGITVVSSGSGTSGSSGSSGQSAPAVTQNGEIRLMDWWNELRGKVITSGTIMTVTDVRTGISFQVRCYSPGNHADSEPLTAEDSAKIKQIRGGSYTWAARPIIVSVGGYKIAASCNGYPHDVQSIKDNDFNGHFCIHFLNSRNHKNNAIDPKQQACVQEAFNSGK